MPYSYGSHLAAETHTRAREFVADAVGATEVGSGAGYHLRGRSGRRIRVAGRHIEGRQPNHFSAGPTLTGEPYDELAVVLFNTDWSVQYAYRLPLETVERHHKQYDATDCRLMIRGDDSWRDDPQTESLLGR